MSKLSIPVSLLANNMATVENSASQSNPSSQFARNWVVEIKDFLNSKDPIDDVDKPTAFIFDVPKAMKAVKPAAYTPQLIALGPHHHWREDLYQMERYKLSHAKRIQTRYKDPPPTLLVERLTKIEYKIRGCYYNYLDLDKDILAWMMAIDGLFLLEFLMNIKSVSNSSNRGMSGNNLGDPFGRKSTYNSILKDISMLENQIPILVLNEILRGYTETTAHDLLSIMMVGICKELSPFSLNVNQPFNVVECAHLLDVLYRSIVPVLDLQEKHQDDDDEEVEDTEDQEAKQREDRCLKEEKKIISTSVGLVTAVRRNNILTLIVKIISRVTAFMEGGLSFSSPSQKERKDSTNKNNTEHPLLEEIMVPSVSQLRKAGIDFCPTNGDITTTKFDKRTKLFYLPVIHLDDRSEVVMRNLVAYEAFSDVSVPLVLARYTELMNGIIDTCEDAKLLREKKIIINQLKSDKEVADLWNGMSKKIRLCRVPFIDKAIADVNLCYHNTRKVKFQRMMKVYVYQSWKFLILVATVLLLFLTALQTFCSVYSCPRMFNIDISTDD